jgi:hypothetical protein
MIMVEEQGMKSSDTKKEDAALWNRYWYIFGNETVML